MIDSHLLETYIAELDALRDHGRRFAAAYPDIASRLDIGSRRSRDPHVERVVESTAFLAARLRLMMEEGAAELPLAMLSMLAPSLVEPIPAMAIAQFEGGNELETVRRGSRFDFEASGQTLACFTTAMDADIAPFRVEPHRLSASGRSADGIGLRVVGTAPERLLLYLGNDAVSAAVLADAFDDHLESIEIKPPVGDPVTAPRAILRVHGFNAREASLPVRPASHQAHRTVIEFMNCPEKFRFVSLNGLTLPSGSELLFRFSRRLELPAVLAPDLITVNRVPVVNLWEVTATPFEITGRQLEYPVRVDALRYRAVECHSVERLGIYWPDSSKPEYIDPAAALGNIQGTKAKWAVRRVASSEGHEVLMYFQGLDYQSLGRQRILASPLVLASNRDIAQHTPVGERLQSVEGIGNWRCSLASAPTAYRPAILSSSAMETLIGYLRSAMISLADGRGDALRDYLSRFPGADRANWIKGIGAVRASSVAAMRHGVPQPGARLTVSFDRRNYPTTSLAMVRRVLSALFDSQRGLNRVEDVHVRPDL